MARPRKPLAKLKQEGGYRKDRHGDRSEPQFDGRPVKPAALDGEAGRLWDRVVELLTEKNVATAIDSSVLQGMCEWWSLYRRAMTALDKIKLKATADEEDNDLDQARKLQMIASRAWQFFAAAAGKFGLTPVDRTRLQIDKKTESELIKFLRGEK